MFKLKYKNSVSVVEVSFESYMDLVYFVASEKIKDEDVVSVTLFGEEMSLFGLADKVKSNIEALRTAENNELDVDELDWEDEDGIASDFDEVIGADEEDFDAVNRDIVDRQNAFDVSETINSVNAQVTQMLDEIMGI